MARHPRRLILVHAPGCHSCEQALPVLKAWANAHRREILLGELEVLTVDLAVYPWGDRKPEIEGTPTTIAVKPDGTWKHEIGAIVPLAELEKWTSEAFK